MKGWTEEEIGNRDLMAPCGMYCGACAIYMATRDGNEKLKGILSKIYGTGPEEIECYGCMQVDPPEKLFSLCEKCDIRQCIRSKGYYSCHQCGEWPCALVENFPYATGVRVMKRAIPDRLAKEAELGYEKGAVEWARSECERYHCPACGEPLFRGAQQCRKCKRSVADELDGSL